MPAPLQPSQTGNATPVRLCYVHCYRDPDYTRARRQIDALRSMHGVDLHLATTRHRGPARYLELLGALWRVHRTTRPDIYLVGFRGHEIFGLIKCIAGRRPVIFDALMSPGSALREEGRAGWVGRLLAPAACFLERRVLHAATLILTDTPQHVSHYRSAFDVAANSIVALPVGAVEATGAPPSRSGGPFRVLFYGSFLPLHGVDVIVRAAATLRDLDIEFRFIGGNSSAAARLSKRCAELQIQGYRHLPWMQFDELLEREIPEADLCLGGPFGDTPQARRVVTTKTTQCLALGRPTVVGAIDGEFGFSNRQNCLLVAQNDPAALAEAIRWAVENQSELRAIGHAGRKLYRERFSLDVIAAGLSAALNAIRPDARSGHP